MAEKTSYIRLDRNIIHWKWWYDHNTLIVFLYLLIQANIKDNGFSGIIIRRGEVCTSHQSIGKSTGLTIQQVRTAISHLKSTGEITSKPYSKFQVITIVNYNKYQDLTGKTPYKQQASNNQLTGKQQHLEKVENIENGRRKRNKKEKSITSPLVGASDVPKAMRMKPIDEGTVDDIPVELRDICPTYPDYWRYVNR